jgi:hypothetical protein
MGKMIPSYRLCMVYVHYLPDDPVLAHELSQ